MANIVPIQEDKSDKNYKRKVYEDIFSRIVSTQETYHNLTRELLKKISSAIPKTKEEVEMLTRSEAQIDVLNNHVGRLEDLKYFCSISLLSEGALITSEELSHTITLVEQLIIIAEMELESDETFVSDWADKKIDLFEQIREVLLQILEHKLRRKHKIGESEIH